MGPVVTGEIVVEDGGLVVLEVVAVVMAIPSIATLRR